MKACNETQGNYGKDDGLPAAGEAHPSSSRFRSECGVRVRLAMLLTHVAVKKSSSRLHTFIPTCRRTILTRAKKSA